MPTPPVYFVRVMLMSILAGHQTFAQSEAAYHPGVSVLDYALSIEVPDSGSSINGDATLTVQRTASLDTLTLDLRKLRVQRITVDGRSTGFARTDSTIGIPLPRGAGGTFKVRVVYSGAVTDGLIARKDSAGRWTYFGDNWPNRARYWIPSVDHPSQKSTVSWAVTAPLGQTVIANGSLIENRTLRMVQPGRMLARWRESKPIPSYLMVIAVAPLVKHDLGETACGLAELLRCVPQSVYVAPEQKGILPGAFQRAGDIVRFFASRVAPFPYEKLAHVQSETRFGGMENATAIFYADALFRKGGVSEGLIAHETAHQWFGDAVTERNWPDLWLSEGFATYFAALWNQHAHGDSAFRVELEQLRSQILGDTTAVPKRPVIDTIETDLLALLNVNSYQKGGFVLHMLRSELGDSAFFVGVRDYYTRHKHGTAVTADLQAALERASGKNLQAFFDQWLRRPGYPEVTVAWTGRDDGRGSTVSVTQSGRFGYFELPLPIVLIDRNGARRSFRIPVAGRAVTRFDVDYPSAEIARVLVDPDVTVLVRELLVR
jgi:aminopeptidase N